MNLARRHSRLLATETQRIRARIAIGHNRPRDPIGAKSAVSHWLKHRRSTMWRRLVRPLATPSPQTLERNFFSMETVVVTVSLARQVSISAPTSRVQAFYRLLLTWILFSPGSGLRGDQGEKVLMCRLPEVLFKPLQDETYASRIRSCQPGRPSLSPPPQVEPSQNSTTGFVFSAWRLRLFEC